MIGRNDVTGTHDVKITHFPRSLSRSAFASSESERRQTPARVGSFLFMSFYFFFLGRLRERNTHAAGLRRMDIFLWTSFLPLFIRQVQGTKRTNQEQRLYTQRSVKTRLSIVRVRKFQFLFLASLRFLFVSATRTYSWQLTSTACRSVSKVAPLPVGSTWSPG